MRFDEHAVGDVRVMTIAVVHGKHDHPRVRMIGAQRGHQIPAAAIGKANVEQYHVKLILCDSVSCLRQRTGMGDVNPFAEHGANDLMQIGVVFDMQHAARLPARAGQLCFQCAEYVRGVDWFAEPFD